eukprot:Filipodium_phascolosomae@DN451_c0_g1_i2.p1
MGNHAASLTPEDQSELVQAANFTERDLKRIYKRFRALDTNGNGELDPSEIFDVPEVAEVKICGRLIFRLLNRAESLSQASLVCFRYELGWESFFCGIHRWTCQTSSGNG